MWITLGYVHSWIYWLTITSVWTKNRNLLKLRYYRIFGKHFFLFVFWEVFDWFWVDKVCRFSVFRFCLDWRKGKWSKIKSQQFVCWQCIHCLVLFDYFFHFLSLKLQHPNKDLEFNMIGFLCFFDLATFFLFRISTTF